MLLPYDIEPKHSVFYNSAFVLEALQQNNQEIDLLSLYYDVKAKKEVSFPIFILCLDWLYLTDIAKLEEGKVKLCS